jgi:hypothetical protein
MSQPEIENKIAPPTASERSSKKRYEKPEVRCERIFETMALSCGKVQATQGQCSFNRKAS